MDIKRIASAAAARLLKKATRTGRGIAGPKGKGDAGRSAGPRFTNSPPKGLLVVQFDTDGEPVSLKAWAAAQGSFASG